MKILEEIDEVVKSSEQLSDELIEVRGREHGLERIPRNVTEVVDVLFGGPPRVQHRSVNVSIPAGIRIDCYTEAANQTLQRFRLHESLQIVATYYALRSLPFTQRLIQANEWLRSCQIEIRYYERRLTSQQIEEVLAEVTKTYQRLASPQTGEEIVPPQGKEILSMGAGRWIVRKVLRRP